MKCVQLRSREFNSTHSYSFEASKKDKVECIDEKIILVNNKPSFFYYEKRLTPTLKLLQEKELLKKIVVDMGAVKFLVGGADLMRPGIKEIDPAIKKKDFVVIVDMNNKKPLIVGVALFDAEEMQNMNSGKVVKNIHYVGDAIWRFV